MQQSSLAFLGCGSARILFSRCLRGNLKTRFQIFFEPPSSTSKVKQFGLPEATDQLSLFRLWLCENFILQVSQRELKNALSDIF